MSLCSERGRFLFEVRPDLFPDGRLGDDELALWIRFYEEREQRNKRR
jgi:hypothetical protein